MTMVSARKHYSLPSVPMKKFLVCFALLLTSLAAAGCDVSSSTPKTSATNSPRVEKLKTNFTAEEARELAAPASDTPGLSVDKSAAQSAAANGYETEAKGIVTRRLFDTNAGSDDERFERLEAAVQALRDDYDTTAPAVNRLMAIEQEIQGLVEQLQVLVDGDAAPADLSGIPPVSPSALNDAPITGTPTTLPPVAAPPIPAAPAIAPPVQVTPPPQAPVAMPPPAPAPVPQAAVPASSGASLVAARVADHNSTTRVVFETTDNIPYTADVDPEQILIVSFAQGSAAGNLSGASMKSSLVKSIDVTPQSNGGMIVAMPLSKNTKIVGQGVLKPDGANKNYRVYIDLAR